MVIDRMKNVLNISPWVIYSNELNNVWCENVRFLMNKQMTCKKVQKLVQSQKSVKSCLNGTHLKAKII